MAIDINLAMVLMHDFAGLLWISLSGRRFRDKRRPLEFGSVHVLYTDRSLNKTHDEVES